ncbi:WXG100 family type VII secretion target [Phytohabitans suffuscus]|uniref:WXG100 family type VII secretion target n=1 Tax=Phytohabitans suffuscus TaxID=624315 RepID=UPI0015659589|nr:WXG100 family type VII secretion target [Phytohabitans suffuscus]
MALPSGREYSAHGYPCVPREAPLGGGRTERGEFALTDTPGVGNVHATQAQLNQMATRCQDVRERLATGMAQLLDRVTDLGGGGMSGSANSALQGVSADLNNGLTKILNALDELSGKISDASTKFGVQDDDAASTIRNAAGATGDSAVISALRG